MKKFLVVLLVVASVFALVSCSGEKETAKMSVGADGKIYVHFDKKQGVKDCTATYDGRSIVSYQVCTTADVTIEGTQFVNAFGDHLNLLTLVATDKTKKNFTVAFTFDGAIFNTAAALIDQIGKIIPAGLKIGLNGGSLGIPDLVSVTNLTVDLGLIDLEGRWNNLYLAPIYLTEDLLGLASDSLTGNIFKAIAPLTRIFVTYTGNGKTACDVVLEKLDASVFDIATGTDLNTVVGEDGVSYFALVLGDSEVEKGIYELVNGQKTTLEYDDVDFVMAKKPGYISGFYESEEI